MVPAVASRSIAPTVSATSGRNGPASAAAGRGQQQRLQHFAVAGGSRDAAFGQLAGRRGRSAAGGPAGTAQRTQLRRRLQLVAPKQVGQRIVIAGMANPPPWPGGAAGAARLPACRSRAPAAARSGDAWSLSGPRPAPRRAAERVQAERVVARRARPAGADIEILAPASTSGDTRTGGSVSSRSLSSGGSCGAAGAGGTNKAGRDCWPAPTAGRRARPEADLERVIADHDAVAVAEHDLAASSGRLLTTPIAAQASRNNRRAAGDLGMHARDVPGLPASW
jgi:hypothetical protein